MPKKIEEITEEEAYEYYVCEICKQLYRSQEMTSINFATFVGKCFDCTAPEREQVLNAEKEKQKQQNKQRLQKLKDYLKL